MEKERGKRQYLQSALSYVQQGKLDRAIAEYEAILRADPSDCSVLNALGDLCARTGNKTEAVGYFMRLAEAYRLDGLYVRAVAVYKKTLKLDPQNVDALLACGELYAEQGLMAEAKLQFQGLADHHLRRGDVAGAVGMYEKMIRMDPGHRPTLHKFAGILVRPGRIDEAFAKLNGLAERLMGAGQAEDARQIYENVVALLRSQGREADALRFARELEALAPTGQGTLLEEEGTAEGFPGEAVHPGLAGLVREDTSPLEILPGSAVESPRGKGLSFDDGSEVDESAAKETAFLGGREPTTIELNVPDASEELVAIPEIDSRTLDDELQEATFFLQQGMLGEARAILERILARDPNHQLAKQQLAQLEASAAPSKGEESPRPEKRRSAIFRVTDANTAQGDFVDLVGELNAELDQEESSLPANLEPEVHRVLRQLDQGIREHVDVTDYETHYNLGLAYKDLELYEKAIQEFRLASNEASYRVRCTSLLGLCYLAKGDPERSIEELLKGLAVTKPGTEERWGILYDLATAYEAFGDIRKALETLTTIHSEAPKFRDIRVRVRDVRARLDPGRGLST